MQVFRKNAYLRTEEILKSMQNYFMFLINTIWQYRMASCHIKKKKPQSFKSTAHIYKSAIQIFFFFARKIQGHQGNLFMNEEEKAFKSSTISLKETALFRYQVLV